ncbi:hypothetical protein PSACC_00166 [Paramicrosporidium saccamoebae]|uniref:Uncharacterized protein n=1 Tax=Paramicrosporidium saccamoebae TaxID=1246581 RepID=A0A2H9TQJ7_9FUNG|nr:hypothetical protein PSACC_00166 [Paramicrosporidium saccamoebae]
MGRRSKSKTEPKSESEPESDSNSNNESKFRFRRTRSNPKPKSQSNSKSSESPSTSVSASPPSSSIPSSASSSMPSLVLSSAPKVARPFSLSSLFRRKSSLTGQSLTTIDETEERTALRRRHTVTDRVGKLLRRVSRRGGEHKLLLDEVMEPMRHVSSFYQSPTGSLAELQTGSMIELKSPVIKTAQPLTPPPVPTVCTQWSPDTVPFKVLTSTRCVLQHNERLIQGHLTVTTRKVHFQATSSQSRLHFEIPYTDIVAIIPSQYYGAGAVHLATQSRLVRIVNLPERTTTLRVLMDEWNMHCRCMLLGTAHTPVRKLTMAQADWLADVVDDSALSGSNLSTKYPCGCDSHFAETVIETTLPGTPLALADTLFGGLNGPQGSYMSSVFWVFEGAIIDEGPWKDIPRHRSVKISVPDPTRPTQRLHYRNEQTVVREAADVFIVSSDVTAAAQGTIGLEGVRLRWCITRTGIIEESHILITGEAESTTQKLSLKTDEPFVFRVIVGRFEDLFAEIRLKNIVIPDPPPQTGQIAQIWDRIRQTFIFVVGPTIMGSFPHTVRSPQRLLIAFFVLSLFGWLLLRWTCPTPVLPVDHLFVEQYLENVIRENRKIMHNVSQRLNHIRDQIEL